MRAYWLGYGLILSGTVVFFPGCLIVGNFNPLATTGSIQITPNSSGEFW